MKTTSQRILLLSLAGLIGGGLTFLTLQRVAARDGDRTSASITVDSTPPARDARMTSSYAAVVEKAAPAVVNIFTTKTVRSPYGRGWSPFFEDPMFRRFFGPPSGNDGPRRQRDLKQRSLGSGVIVNPEGYIVTNDHVVDGADEIQIALENSRKQYTPKIVGRDPRTDIALLRIEAEDLPFATFADSDQVKVGDVVLAIGNPFGVGQTVTMGIVSAVGRGGMGIEDYEDFIQTDAAINPGNSGGALVDAEGRLVGINTAILSPSGGNNGVGFAIPANQVRETIDQLSRNGSVSRGFLGVGIQDLTPELAKEFRVPETGGALVTDVAEESAAAEAGFQQGDVILEFDGKPVRDSRTLRLMVGQRPPGSRVAVTYLRDGKTKTAHVTLKQSTGSSQALGAQPEPSSDDTEALQGVGVGDLNADTRQQFSIPHSVNGALIVSVEPDSAAYEAGLRPGDVIQEINRQRVKNAAQAVELTRGTKDGRTLVHLWRQGAHRYVIVKEGKGN